ncbi:MAG: hypothetical protein AAGA54_12900 [Myxococcota bacterium]
MDLGDLPDDTEGSSGAGETEDGNGDDAGTGSDSEPGSGGVDPGCTGDEACVASDGSSGTCQPNGQCSYPDPACPTGQTYGPEAGDLAGQCVPPFGVIDSLDVLFVIDNSGSMGLAQAQLQSSAPSIIAGLEATGLDYRIGITTTDDGNYWCESFGTDPERGHFVRTSCRERLSDFVFGGDGSSYENEACLDQCNFDTLPLAADATDPWLSPSSIEGDVTMAEVLSCALPQGVNGCGFESPLESLWKATKLTEDPAQPEFGFLRPNAHLAIVIVSDEIDCSPTTQEIFEETGTKIFWSLPEEQASPSSAVCWNAGIECVGDPAGYDSCVAANKAPDGTSGSEDDAVIRPLSKYSAWFDELRDEKVGGGEVYMFGLLGVPAGYQSRADINYAQGPNAEDASSFQANFGIAPGCASETTEAVPPVRMLELITAGPQSGPGIYSICANDYADYFGAMFAEIDGG